MDARTHSLRFRPASFLWHDARFRFGDRPTFNGRMHVTVATKLSALLNKKHMNINVQTQKNIRIIVSLGKRKTEIG